MKHLILLPDDYTKLKKLQKEFQKSKNAENAANAKEVPSKKKQASSKKKTSMKGKNVASGVAEEITNEREKEIIAPKPAEKRKKSETGLILTVRHQTLTHDNSNAYSTYIKRRDLLC